MTSNRPASPLADTIAKMVEIDHQRSRSSPIDKKLLLEQTKDLSKVLSRMMDDELSQLQNGEGGQEAIRTRSAELVDVGGQRVPLNQRHRRHRSDSGSHAFEAQRFDDYTLPCHEMLSLPLGRLLSDTVDHLYKCVSATNDVSTLLEKIQKSCEPSDAFMKELEGDRNVSSESKTIDDLDLELQHTSKRALPYHSTSDDVVRVFAGMYERKSHRQRMAKETGYQSKGLTQSNSLSDDRSLLSQDSSAFDPNTFFRRKDP